MLVLCQTAKFCSQFPVPLRVAAPYQPQAELTVEGVTPGSQSQRISGFKTCNAQEEMLFLS